jgi:hypothetical protein
MECDEQRDGLPPPFSAWRLVMIIPRANILGVRGSVINMEIVLHAIQEWISRQDCYYVCFAGMHGVVESGRDEKPQRLGRQHFTTPYSYG